MHLKRKLYGKDIDLYEGRHAMLYFYCIEKNNKISKIKMHCLVINKVTFQDVQICVYIVMAHQR